MTRLAPLVGPRQRLYSPRLPSKKQFLQNKKDGLGAKLAALELEKQRAEKELVYLSARCATGGTRDIQAA